MLAGTVAYLALGSNLGDRRGYLAAASGALMATAKLALVARSPLFETEPVADDPQPRYLNAAARIETDLPPRQLLDLCLEVERQLGRQRPPGHARAARTIDIDLLLYGDLVIDLPGLRVPHPELLARPFVRVPLARVALPGLRHPGTGERLDFAHAHPDVRELPDAW
jgi:2-amino-4-hydroxy-6-hydroxymethyldihydropteridine diphosphokinase